MQLVKLILISLIFISCASTGSSPSRSEAPPCSNCRSGQEPSFDIKVYQSFRDSSVNFALDSGEVIGVLPALHVIIKHPEKCDYCHSFSESAVEFDFAAREDSILRTKFPNNERTLLFPGSQVPEKDSAEFWNAFANLKEIPLSENKEFKSFLRKLSHRYKIRYLAFASFIEVNLKDKRTFEWESEWSLWDAKKGEQLFWDYQSLTAKSKNSAPVDRGWAACWWPF